MILGLFTETLLCAFLAYATPLHQAIGTRDVQFVHWLPSCPYSILIFLYDELRKYIIRQGRKTAYLDPPFNKVANPNVSPLLSRSFQFQQNNLLFYFTKCMRNSTKKAFWRNTLSIRCQVSYSHQQWYPFLSCASDRVDPYTSKQILSKVRNIEATRRLIDKNKRELEKEREKKKQPFFNTRREKEGRYVLGLRSGGTTGAALG